MNEPRRRAADFCDRFGLRVPILLAPMAGACPPSTSLAVMRAGGMGACAALLMSPNEINEWVTTVRAGSSAPFQINLWVPDPPPVRDRGSIRASAGMGALHPVGRVGDIDDVVGGVLYLESAPFVTGEVLHIDGGQSAGR